MDYGLSFYTGIAIFFGIAMIGAGVNLKRQIKKLKAKNQKDHQDYTISKLMEEETPKKEESKPAAAESKTYATGTPSPAAKKILDEKGINPNSVFGTGRDGRITKDDAVNAVPSMGNPTGGNRRTSHSKM